MILKKHGRYNKSLEQSAEETMVRLSSVPLN